MADDLAAAVTKALAAVKDPASGRDVVAAGMVQGLAVRDGMVHFALQVPREAAAAMEPRARCAFRNRGADRASRRTRPGSPPSRAPRPRQPRPHAAFGCARDHRGRFRQGRRWQIHHRGQSGGGLGGGWPQGRAFGCGYLRAVAPANAGHARKAAVRGPAHHAAQPLGAEGHVHRLPGGRRNPDDLARPHGDGRFGADDGPGRLGPLGCDDCGYAAGDRRCAVDHVSTRALSGGGDCLNPAGCGAVGRASRGADV